MGINDRKINYKKNRLHLFINSRTESWSSSLTSSDNSSLSISFTDVVAEKTKEERKFKIKKFVSKKIHHQQHSNPSSNYYVGDNGAFSFWNISSAQKEKISNIEIN